MPRSERIAAMRRRRETFFSPEPLKPSAHPASTVAKAESPTPFGDWVARQERLNPLPKPPWFSIESEIEIDPPEPVRPRIEHIQRAVAKHYGVSRSDLISARRTAQIVHPRMVAIYICKEMTLRSYPEISRKFGNRDHTTAIHSVRKMAGLVERDAVLAAEIDTIMDRLRSA